MKKCLLVLSGALLSTGMLFAQPANDNCSAPIPINYAEMEGDVVLVAGDTRGGTFDATVPNPCSATWTADDVWFALTTPDVLPPQGIVVKTYFGTEANDILAVGMAFHVACDDTPTLACFSQSDPAVNSFTIGSKCIEPNTTYLIRVWSGGSATDNSGTFRIGAFAVQSSDNVLWTETFEGGLGDWTTSGTCGGNPDSNANAIWRWTPDGVYDMGAYANAGVGVKGLTFCDGAVGVDSDFDDNAGIEGNFGAGRCPVGDGSQYILQSPSIDHSAWGVAGLTLTWTQGLREFNSDYFVSYRIYENGAWTDWKDFQVNDEFPVNSGHFSDDHQRVFLGGAQAGDSLQLRFVYNANYYYWGVDDIMLVEAPCVDMKSQANFYAIAPAAQTPSNQLGPWYPLNDVYNSGACEQTNVNLNCTIVDQDGIEAYNVDLSYGTMGPDSIAENVNFPVPVDMLGAAPGAYTGTYTVTSDMSDPDNDYNFDDNTNSFEFRVTDNIFALDNGSTRTLAPAASNYDAGAPFAWVYGSYFHFVSEAKVQSVLWGASNPADIAGIPVNIILYSWVDANEDEICQSSEREIVGFSEIVFDGTEPADLSIETVLENFNDPGQPVICEANKAYLVVMQYNAVDQTSFFIQASDAYDYSAIILSQGQVGAPTYASVLGLPADGNVQGIDYGLGVNGGQTFGSDIVPVMQLVLEPSVGTKEVLADDNIVRVFPNPASEKINLQLDFVQPMERVQVTMMDVTGKTLFNQSYENMDQANLEFDVTRLVPGSYMMHVGTDKGIRTVPFVKIEK